MSLLSSRVMCAVSFVALTASCGRAGLDPFPPAEGGDSSQGGSGATPSAGGGGSNPDGAGGVGAEGGVGGSGGGTGCVLAQECEDFNDCTSNRCEGGQCTFPLRDDDN